MCSMVVSSALPVSSDLTEAGSFHDGLGDFWA